MKNSKYQNVLRSFTHKTLNVVLIVLVGFNGQLQPLAESYANNADESPKNSPAALFVEPSYPAYSDVEYSPDFGTPYQGDQPDVPAKDPVGIAFSMRADPSVLAADGEVTIWVEIINGQSQPAIDLRYTDGLESGVEFVASSDADLVYSASSRTVSLELKELAVGDTLAFSYTLRVDLESTKAEGEYLLRKAELTVDEQQSPITTSAIVWIGQSGKSEKTEVGILTSNEWVEAGPVTVFATEGALEEPSVLEVSLVEDERSGPELQFEVNLKESPTLDDATDGDRLEVGETLEGPFAEPVFLEVDLSSVGDLSAIPAGQEPYVAIYDAENEVWVKQPILEVDYEVNTVTVEAKHFSTWGGGLGDSLPQNGANVLLFDQPYASLFTGGAQYSIPVWTPPGRAGMAPSIALSYSSKTIDGVLGDVQAPWVGVGWNIDGIEIVRKITTTPTGYGYENEFALTFNGEQHNLIVDPANPERYHTERASFLYIERHNLALGNADAVANSTKEWWEVVATDGTRYRLGWNSDSEQRTLMYGYKCTTGSPCTTPDTPYSALGYAGNATNVVASRWRVDLVMDRHGNTIEYSYLEEEPDPASQIPAFDRASYMDEVEFTGHMDIEDWPAANSPDLAPAYSVEFVTTARSGDIQPLDFGIWDQWDTKQLAAIEIRFGAILVREYTLGFTTEAAPNANGTLTLTSLTVSGGGFSEEGLAIPLSVSREGFSEEGVDVPLNEAATIEFSYENLANRADDSGAQNEWLYPRLVSIHNGYQGELTYTYGNDGRGTNSWFNYRVVQAEVDSGLGVAAVREYSYGTAVYANQPSSGLGALVGHPTTTETTRTLADSADLLDIVHTFGTAGLDIGRELLTDWKEPSGDTLRRVRNTYVTDNSQAPFEGWNYRYLLQTEQFELIDSALSLISETVFQRNPANGNLVTQSDYLGASLYRKQNYEYNLNADPNVYILDKISRQTLRAANNSLLGDTRYVYDGGAGLSLGELTLTQSLTGTGSQTVDASYEYDQYGNLIKTRSYTGYGTAGSAPAGGYNASEIVYDYTSDTFPIKATNALGQISETEYLYSLGVPLVVTDPNDWTSTTTYDGLGRVLTTTAPEFEQANVTFDYPDPVGGEVAAPYSLSMQILDTLGPSAPTYRTVTGVYDGLSRILSQSVGGITTETEYNDQGLVARQSLPYSGGSPQFTENEYDLLGRLTETTAPGGITSQMIYEGLTVTSVDPNLHAVARTNDGLGRMIAVREYSGQYGSHSLYAVTQYSYDLADRLVQVRDNVNNLTTITYDWLGRKTSMTDPDMGEWEYGYDAQGNLIQQIDARGQVLAFEYDGLNRLLKKNMINTAPEPDEVVMLASYTYGVATGPDGNTGFRVRMVDESGTTNWSYGNYGRTVTETREVILDGPEDVEEATFITVSDWLGRVKTITYPDGESVNYSYDSLGRAVGMSRIPSAGPEVGIATLAYNALSQIEAISLGNGVSIDNAYDGVTHRLLNRTADNGVEDLINFSYDYDNVGNITSLVDDVLGESFEFEYDQLDRLTSAEGVSTEDFMAYRQTFDYDSLGNILQLSNFAPGLAGAGTYEEDYAGLWFLGDWEPLADASASGGGLARTGQPGASVRFEFEGDEVGYVRRTGPGDGVVHVYIDGVFVEQVDNSQGSVAYQQTYTQSNLGPGSHWIEIKIASGTINLDAFVVSVTGPTATPTSTETTSETPTETASETPTPTDTEDTGYIPNGSLAGNVGLNAMISYGQQNAHLANAHLAYQATDTPTVPPTNTLTPSETPVPSNTYTPSQTPTRTLTPSNTPTPSNTLTASVTPSATAVPGLLARWQFNENTGSTLGDTQGATNDNGTISGAAWTTHGLSGSALLFDGSNDYANVPNSAELNPSAGFTISAWIYPTAAGGGTKRTIMMKAAAPDYALRLNADGYIEFWINDVNPKNVTGPIAPLNTWAHVAGVYDKHANQMRLYANGVLVGAQTVSGSIGFDTGALRIGANLSAADVATLYGAVPTPTPTVSNTPSITPTPWPTLTSLEEKWGNGADGDVTISSTVNIDTTASIAGRTCADSPSFKVSSLSGTQATLSTTPASGCLVVGDEILLINLAANNSSTTNVGNYEFLRVASISGGQVTFNTAKTKFYGNNSSDDTGIGSNQFVFIQRVPNYDDLTISGSFVASTFNVGNSKTGLITFRVKGTLSGAGSINVAARGYGGGIAGYDNCGGCGGYQGYSLNQTVAKSVYGNFGGGGAGAVFNSGGGGGYGSAGSSGNSGQGGAANGTSNLSDILLGSGGGGGGGANDKWGGGGGHGGGIILIYGETINFSGAVYAYGSAGESGQSGTGRGGGGSGGSIYIAGNTISLGTLNAAGGSAGGAGAGAGSVGRIALFAESSLSHGSASPSPYTPGPTATPTQTFTPSNTPTITPTPTVGTPGPLDDWGDGRDGNVTITETVNIHTTNSIAGRSCADGGDAVAYSVVGLTDTVATLSQAVSAGCLAVGDKVLLINLQGTSTKYGNVGNYEVLEIASLAGDGVVFTAAKEKFYGDNTDDDTNIGTATNTQRVMLMRVPQYDSLTITGTLTGSAWNGSKFGVFSFLVRGTLSGSGSITATGLGYRGGDRGHHLDDNPIYGTQGESISKAGGYSMSANLGGGGSEQINWGDGAGAGYGSGGLYNSNAFGGGTYGSVYLSSLFMGSGGAGSAASSTQSNSYGLYGLRGGGGLLIKANQIDFTGSISSNGLSAACNGATCAGAGAGGSIRIDGDIVEINSLAATGGEGSDPPEGEGGNGRIAAYYQTSFTYTSSDPIPGYSGTPVTPTPTPTPTPTTTPEAAPAGWLAAQYAYEGALTHPLPHGVTSVQRGLETDTYEYDENGNMIERVDAGITWTQEFNAENRLASVSNGSQTWTFVYDGDGNRVKQINYDESISLFLGGGIYTVVDAAGAPAVIKYYSVAGQRVALSGPDGLQYMLTDHLGSIAAITDDSGGLLSEQRYLPFGGARLEALAQTDFGYTGQRDLAAAGLMDYDARWYDAGLGRFTQPDTIVPGLANPPALNRFSYVLNNPIRFTDPNGHCPQNVAMLDGLVCGKPNLPAPPPTLAVFVAQPGQMWKQAERDMIGNQVMAVAKMLASSINNSFYCRTSGDCSPISAEDAFLATYGGPVTFIRASVACTKCWAQTSGANTIYVYKNIGSDRLLEHKNLITHELGHAFNNATGGIANQVPSRLIRPLTGGSEDLQIDHVDGSTNTFYGFGCSALCQYGFDASNRAGEEWADMFVAQTHNLWGDASADALAVDKSEWIGTSMFNLIMAAILNSGR